MKIVKFTSPQRLRALRVQCSLTMMQHVAWPGHTFDLRNDEQLVFTGAKVYYEGGGWWRMCGYAADGSDLLEAMHVLIAKDIAACKPGVDALRLIIPVTESVPVPFLSLNKEAMTHVSE